MADSFEEAFADIAYALLQEKAMKLMPDLLGFEVVEKNDENTKAVGLFAFKVGGQFLYIPVFFLQGEVKPLELFYIKDQEVFVPFTEKWIDSLLKQKPLVLGHAEQNKNLNLTTPNFETFATPPVTGKYVTASVNYKECKFKDFLEKSEDGVKTAFINELRSNPKFLAAIEKYYPFDGYKSALSGVQTKTAADKVTITRVVDKGSSPEVMKALSPGEKKEVMSGVPVVQDTRPREATSTLYDTQYPQKFQNPNESSVYHVIDSEGNLRKCLVIVNPKCFTKLYGTHNAVVVDLESKQHISRPPAEIWVKNKFKIDDFSEVWKKALEPKQAKIGQAYILLSIRGNKPHSSEPFRVMQIVKDSSGVSSLRVRPESDKLGFTRLGDKYRGPGTVIEENDRPKRIKDIVNKLEDASHTSSETCSDEMYPKIIFSPKVEGSLYMLGNDLMAPGEYKLLEVEKRKSVYSQDLEFDLGKADDVAYNLLANKDLNVLSVQGMNGEYVVKVDSKQSKPLGKNAALDLLSNGFGLYGRDAMSLVDEAGWAKTANRFVKIAQGYYSGMPNTDPKLMANQDGVAPFLQMAEERMHPLQRAYPTPPQIGGDENMYKGPGEDSPVMDVNTAMQAAQLGQKNVFDHAMLGTLAKSSNTLELINSYLPDLQAALDKLGRILYLFWWKGEDFKELYGISELKETEDLLRTVFKNLGDLTIELKSKERVAPKA